MPLKLLVRRREADDPPEVYTFDRAEVTLGRDAAVDLVLRDASNVLSKRHAAVRREGTAVYVVDLGSKNGTYYNGHRLPSQQPTMIREGDEFSVGDFSVEVQLEAEPAPAVERTVFAADFANPFAVPAEQLAQALNMLRQGYQLADDAFRDEALREALDDALPLGSGDAGRVVGHYLCGGLPNPDAPSTQPSAPAARKEDPWGRSSESQAPRPNPADPWALPPTAEQDDGDTSEVRMQPVGRGPTGREAAPRPAPHAAAPPDDRTQALLDTLLGAAGRLVGIPSRFRYEFIGQTVIETGGALLREMSKDELRDYFLNPSLDAATFAERCRELEEAIGAVLMHQLALLEGYRASVSLGARRLLDALDPAAAEAAGDADKGLLRKLPLMQEAATLERLKEAHRDLSAEDWAAAERRAYRPAFIKAYLARMSKS